MMLMTVSERGVRPRAGLFSLVLHFCRLTLGRRLLAPVRSPQQGQKASKRDDQPRQHDPERKVDFGHAIKPPVVVRPGEKAEEPGPMRSELKGKAARSLMTARAIPPR